MRFYEFNKFNNKGAQMLDSILSTKSRGYWDINKSKN